MWQESSPDKSDFQVKEDLSKLWISVTVNYRCRSWRYIIGKVQLVMAGAEDEMESGGMLNKIVTYRTAVCAQQMNKSVYVVAVNFKCVLESQVNQKYVPGRLKYGASTF